jgi:hypothetical protein
MEHSSSDMEQENQQQEQQQIQWRRDKAQELAARSRNNDQHFKKN